MFIRVHAIDNGHNSRTEEAGHRAGGSSGPPRGLKNTTDRHALWITLPGDRRRSSVQLRETNRRANLLQSKKRIITDISALYVTSMSTFT